MRTELMLLLFLLLYYKYRSGRVTSIILSCIYGTPDTVVLNHGVFRGIRTRREFGMSVPGHDIAISVKN